MDAALYSTLYNVLRRHAKDWDIDYTRYTHAQLRYAFELNKGVVDASLRKKLLPMSPVNAYLAHISPEKTEVHKPRHGSAIRKAEPLPDASTSYASFKKPSSETAPSFALPAPKEAFPWTSVSL